MDDNSRNIDQSLLSAYLRTTYQVEQPAIQIHIGRSSRALQALLQKFGATSWVFITAWNPKSILLSQKENDARHEKLVEMVEKRGFPFFIGYGIGADDTWQPEQSLLILGIPQKEAINLGQQFQQHAIVFGTADGLPELVFCQGFGV